MAVGKRKEGSAYDVIVEPRRGPSPPMSAMFPPSNPPDPPRSNWYVCDDNRRHYFYLTLPVLPWYANDEISIHNFEACVKPGRSAFWSSRTTCLSPARWRVRCGALNTHLDITQAQRALHCVVF